MKRHNFKYTVPDVCDGVQINWKLELSCYGLPDSLIPCTSCGGQGKSRGFGSYDDDKCDNCGGSGSILNPIYERMNPNPPAKLLQTLHKVMKDAWNEAENEKFELKMY